MAKIIEAKAIISGEEKLSPLLDKLSKKFDQVAKTAAGAAGVDKMAASIAKIGKEMAAIDKYNASGGFAGVKAARERLALAQQAAAVAAKAAREGQGDARKLEADQRRAIAAVRAASRAFEMERAAALAAKRGLDEAGISAGRVVDHQRRIAAAVDKATASLNRQDQAARRHAAHGSARQLIGQTAATYVGAHSVAHGIKETVLAGSRLQHERVALRNAGRTDAEMIEIEHASHETTKSVPTSTFTENLKVINETTGAFGTLHHAIENLPFMQKSASVLHAAAGDKIHEGAGELGNKLARFFEERQVASDTPTFQREAEGLIRAMAFTRGNFNPAEAMNFAQQAKSSLPNYSERFLTKIAPSLVTMMGGHRAGTAANAFTSVVMGKVNDKKQAEEWMRYGLLDPKMAMMKAGHAVGWRAGAVKDTNLALSDPLRWIEEVMLPAMKKKGVKVEDRLELSKALGTMFRNQNANVWANDLAQPASRYRLHKDEENINKAGTLDEIYKRLLAEDPTVAMTAFTASLDNLTAAASSPAMKTAAEGITWVATSLQTVALAAKDHPNIALGAGVGTAGLALGGAGWMTYKLMTGFGLAGSAVALDGSAAALTAAATALGGGKVAGVAAGAATGTAAAAATGVGGALTLGSIIRGGPIAAAVGGVALMKSDSETPGQPIRTYLRSLFGLADDHEPAPWKPGGAWDTQPKAPTEVNGHITGEAKITIEIPGLGNRTVNVPLNGLVNANGPGSVGVSSPDAFAHPPGP